MKRKWLTALLLFMLLLPMVLPAHAESVDMVDDPIVASGSGGTNITWVLTQSGTMTFSGRGALEYNAPNNWQNYKSKIKKLVLEEGISYVCTMAFSGCGYIETVEIPKSVCYLGIEAFRGCTSLKKLVFPGRVSEIAYDALGFNSKLKEIYFYGDAPSFINANAFGAGFKTTATVYYPANNATWAGVINKNYGGVLTWVPMDDSGTEEEISVTINGNVGNVTAPTDGWKEGTNTFSVSGDTACVVAVSQDGGNTYTRLKATATGTENAYQFTADNVTTDTIIEVLALGDVNGDGGFTNADVTMIRAVYAGKRTVDALRELASDVNGDGSFTNADVTMMRAAYAGKSILKW